MADIAEGKETRPSKRGKPPPYAVSDAFRARALVDALLRWYGVNARDLPWRRSRDPYSIWISEIMAQQTRITALLPYYERFMERFPSVGILAAADIGDVLKVWEGLGYYSRAHNLHRAARVVAGRYGGELPADPGELRSLPGIGDYTAGAIASIAFGKPVPAIDGNVLRVFSRVEANHTDISLPVAKTSLASYLHEMIPPEPERASVFTQATMELGALICLPGKPNCGGCPLHSLCRARELGVERELPVKSPKKQPRALEKTILVILARQANEFGESRKVLMRRRTENLLRGLWEFCVLDGKIGEAEACSHLTSVGLRPCAHGILSLGEVRHVFTHMIWNMSGLLCSVAETAAPEGYRWVSREELTELAMPAALAFYRERALFGETFALK